MSGRLAFRLAAAVLVLFAALHTFGFLTFTPPTPEGLAVRDAMNNVGMHVGGDTFTYGGFYRGMGLSVTAYLVFCAIVAWQLGALRDARQVFRVLAGSSIAVQIAGFALSCLYISLFPALFSAAVAALLAWGFVAREREPLS